MHLSARKEFCSVNKQHIDKKTLLIEIGNAISHGIGTGLAITGLVFLIIRAAHSGSVMRVVTFTIYGSILVLFYLSSTLFHALVFTRARHVFQVFDHCMIYALIAGTYTPYCLVSIKGWLGWTMFGVIWGLAVIGIIYKSIWLKHKSALSTLVYVLMGWLCIFAFFPLWNVLGPVGFGLLLAGGITFTIGALLYSRPTDYTHLIWHFFVLVGTGLMYFSILLYV
ncbi:hemolysin III family protein [Limosilactobacillus panis]|nr:hemolysin III family protein [Limosilactobacillus panis]QZN92218.1 hemolysin III family protein [Limosilactobacillus panis]